MKSFRTAYLLAFMLLIPVMAVGESDEESSLPMDYSFRGAKFTVNIEDGFARVEGDYSLEVLRGGEWLTIPLGYSGTGIYKVLVDGRPPLMPDNSGEVSILLKGKGTHRLKVSYAVPAPMSMGPGSFNVSIIPVFGATLDLTAPAGVGDIAVNGAIITDKARSGTKTRISAVISSMNSISVSYNVSETREAVRPEEKLPPKLYSAQELLVSINDDVINFIATFNYEIKHSPLSTFSIAIPKNYDVIDVNGQNIAGWKVEEGVLKVSLDSKTQGNYQLRVEMSAKRANPQETLVAPEIKTLDAERESGYIAIESLSSIEVLTEKIEWLTPLDATEIPSSLRYQAKNPVIFAFRFSRHPYEAKLSVVRHREQQVLPAAIDSINMVTLITQDGKSVTRAIFEVKNNNVQYLKLNLPEKAEIWSAFLDGMPIKPAINDKGQTLLLLKKADVNSTKVSFTLDIIYFAPIPKMAKKGSLDFVFPKTDMPASEMLFTLYLPPKFKYKHFEGDLEKLTTEPISFMKFDDTIFKKKEGSANLSDTYGEVNRPETIIRQNVLEQEFSSDMKAMGYVQSEEAYRGQFAPRGADQPSAQDADVAGKTHSMGSLPVKFTVPLRGEVMRFSTILLVRDAPKISFDYKKRWKVIPWDYVILGGKILLWALLAALLASLTRWFWNRPRGAKKSPASPAPNKGPFTQPAPIPIISTPPAN